MGKGSNRRKGDDEEYRKTWERVWGKEAVKKPKELEQLLFPFIKEDKDPSNSEDRIIGS